MKFRYHNHVTRSIIRYVRSMRKIHSFSECSIDEILDSFEFGELHHYEKLHVHVNKMVVDGIDILLEKHRSKLEEIDMLLSDDPNGIDYRICKAVFQQCVDDFLEKIHSGKTIEEIEEEVRETLEEDWKDENLSFRYEEEIEGRLRSFVEKNIEQLRGFDDRNQVKQFIEENFSVSDVTLTDEVARERVANYLEFFLETYRNTVKNMRRKEEMEFLKKFMDDCLSGSAGLQMDFVIRKRVFSDVLDGVLSEFEF